MPKLYKTAVALYSPQQLFDLVSDVASYPEFLPFCEKTEIHENSDTHMIADMHIGYKRFSGTFQSYVEKEPCHKLSMRQTHGNLKYMLSTWNFHPHSSSPSCTIEFMIDFEPTSWIVGKLISPLMNELSAMMMTSFLNRAKELHG